MARAGEAELLVNLGGHLRWRPLLRRARRRAFVDLDPGFTQIWHAQGHDVGLVGHDLYFSVGENVGTRRCQLPTGGIRWRSIRQPVVLERWPVGEGDEFSRFTTVANWRGPYGRLSWAGRTYGLKVHEFRRFLGVPGLLASHSSWRSGSIRRTGRTARLDEQGWRLVDPRIVADTSGFHRFIRTSGAEFSVAQGVYVETRSGWFSDRTVRYLASGRPALVQDTGFSEYPGRRGTRRLQQPGGGGEWSAPDRGELRAASRSGPAAGRGVLRPGAGPRPAARRRRGRAMMTILLSGMLAGVPRQGGASWAVLRYVLGLRRLGHRVVFVEPVGDLGRSAPYLRELVDAFGLSAALVDPDSGETVGLSRAQLAAEGADLLLNLAGS